MPETKGARPKRALTRQGKVRKEFWLDPKALKKAQEALGVETERETVEVALDLVTFRHEVVAGLAALDGLELDRRE
jgi:Arc/MetJ family transcription regulator